MANETTYTPIIDIMPSKTNPRKKFDGQPMKELQESIRTEGIRMPLIIRPSGKDRPPFQLVTGERRLRSAQALCLTQVPTMLMLMQDSEAVQLQLLEFLQSVDISPLEEAESLFALLDHPNQSFETAGNRVGKSKVYIARMIKLLDLISPAKKALNAGVLPLAHAREICRLTMKDQQRAFEFALKSWQEFEDGKEYANDLNPSAEDEKRAIKERKEAATVCSLADLKEFIQLRLHLDLRDAAFDKKDPNLVPSAGGCTDCPFRTGYAKELFDDIKGGDTCTNSVCFEDKQDAHLIQLKAQLKKEKKRYVEITEDLRKPDGHPGAMTERSFKYVKAGSCKHVRIGVLIDGANKGHTRTICSDKKKCRTHFGDVIRGRVKEGKPVEPDTVKKVSPEEAEEERIRALRTTIDEQIRGEMGVAVLMPAIIEKLPKKVGKEELLDIYNYMHDNGSWAGLGYMKKHLGLKGKELKMSEGNLTQLILGGIAYETLDQGYDETAVDQVAERFKLDLKAIEKPIREKIEKAHAKELQPKLPKPEGVKAAKGVGTLGVVCPVCEAKVGKPCSPVKGKSMDMLAPSGKGRIHEERLSAAIEASSKVKAKKQSKKTAK